MKHFLAALTFAVSVPAFAVYAPDWERPIQQAEMDVVHADGYFTDVQDVSLVLNRRDGVKTPATSFYLTLSLPNDKGLNTAKYSVPVDEIFASDKGNLVIKGQVDVNNNDGVRRVMQVEVSRPYPKENEGAVELHWSAELRFLERGETSTNSTLQLSGTPESVVTIQRNRKP